MENLKIKIGQRIKEIRVKQGLSQEKLALLADLDRTYIPSIESGRRNISITVLEKISNDKSTFRLSKLDISISYMDSKINKLFLKINLKDGF